MRARIAATVVLAGAVMVLTAGCNFITPQDTTSITTTEAGVSSEVGSLDIRNAIVFTDDSGETASLSITLINNSSTSRDVNFQYESTSGKQTASVTVPGNTLVRRGTQNGDEQIILTNLEAKPGALAKIFVQYGSATGKSIKVPVLNGSFKMYATLQPSPTVSSTPTDGASTIPFNAPTTPAG
ncbi:hypothetical protein [Frondihabitans sp. PAMC 28766]|uniref:hypothetical protein n=1 Tax=Frondihabitans sp. PAMC 28766 TaxID=1795630 RepID=UPI0012FF8F35|nr:hypothetical protein [Frondihabitans sp. PAMC 28766]